MAAMLPMLRRTALTLAAIVPLAAAASAARAQCTPEWLPSEGRPGVTGNGQVSAAVTWDPDGAGPQPEVLVLGGSFLGAGSLVTPGIAIWDGAQWTSPGGGMNGTVRALIVYNGDLIAAGNFTEAGGVAAPTIARWDGAAWHPMGSGASGNPNSMVFDLELYDGDLYAAGRFSHMDGVPASGVARWDGSGWHGLQGGVGVVNGLNVASAMTVQGGTLVVGGAFSTVNGNAVPADGVARWDGSSWTGLNDAYNVISIEGLGVYNDELIAGGSFVQAGTNVLDFIVRWNGTGWEELGGGTNDHCTTFGIYNGDLIVGGWFTNAGGVSSLRIARWNGISWSSLGFGMRGVGALAVFGDELIVGGASSQASGLATSFVLRYDGEQPSYLGPGMDGVVYDFETYAGELIAAGSFAAVTGAGDNVVTGLARRTDTGWERLGGQVGGGYVLDVALYNGDLIASGTFTEIAGNFFPGIARWDGAAWHTFGGTPVQSMIVHEGSLYAVGLFGPNQRVGRWDDELQNWVAVGAFPNNSGITALTAHNGDLIAGGIGGIGVSHSVWRWDFDNPGTWQPVGQHLGFVTIETLAVYNGELLAGGYAGNVGAVVRFDGTSWVEFAGGLYLGNDNPDEVLAAFDLLVHGGSLYVAGTFSFAGAQQYDPDGVEVNHIARWDGAAWHALGTGTDDAVVALHAHNNEIIAGGWFTIAGDAPAGHWARWGCEGTPCPADWDGDGVVNSFDISTFLTSWLASVQNGTLDADFSGDGAVNSADISAFLAVWLPAAQGGC